MSHFFTVVIVPGDTPAEQIEELVTRLLAPYDENLRVDPYKVYLDDQEMACMASQATITSFLTISLSWPGIWRTGLDRMVA